MNHGHWLVHAVIMGMLLTTACKETTHQQSDAHEEKAEPKTVSVALTDYDTTQWKELTTAMGFVVDMRYATTNNFVHQVIYPCGRCFLKPKAADALGKINTQLKAKGLAVKLFDCYRPAPAQQKLWDKVPDRNYVAPPWEGSMHSRGVAVDLTLVSLDGKELDMGTTYDFFGPEAHHDYTKHTPAVLKNRRLLKTTMEAAGFQGIRTEWWHYSLKSVVPPLYDWQWSCE